MRGIGAKVASHIRKNSVATKFSGPHFTLSLLTYFNNLGHKSSRLCIRFNATIVLHLNDGYYKTYPI